MPFFPDITIPPNVVLPFSYIRGLFVYCPFLLDLFSFRWLFVLENEFRSEIVSGGEELAGEQIVGNRRQGVYAETHILCYP